VKHFETEEQSDGFDRMIASVNEVSDHDELAGGDSSTLGEQILNIVKLTMDISGEVDRRVDADNVRFFG
jgi:hypothetical protein